MQTSQITLALIPKVDLKAAARLCAEAMAENPLHLKVFGQDINKRQRRLTRLFSGLLPYIARNGELSGAYVGQQLVGVLGRLSPGHCQPYYLELIKLAPALLASNSPLGWLRTRHWLNQWAKFDPATPHWHLGPLAVAPNHQRQGIGRALMEVAINEANGVSLYLETDKLSNVLFYQKLGFHITATPTLLGTKTWLMMNKQPYVTRYTL
ncbi:GNAT family N-acetyltransferase [Oceanisphaera sp. IT1-181]|uniref:GNAT family N-acetyltransferase n=1 Tax=Oceanisphaera sp. IT1-181 TaxID=3081199 RepID=UPI0029C9B6DF|nr:GNAT family N-acetyltransferase [Oceanisphaera sp. IT1-181]